MQPTLTLDPHLAMLLGVLSTAALHWLFQAARGQG
jgi:hypothetical protein